MSSPRRLRTLPVMNPGRTAASGERTRPERAPVPGRPDRAALVGAIGNRRLGAIAATVRARGLLQRTPTEADALIALGRRWRKLKYGQASEKRKTFEGEIDELNGALSPFGLSVASGPYQAYEPLVRQRGKLKTYETLVQEITSAADGGAAAARSFLKWRFEDVAFTDLSPPLQDLAVITLWSEVGRGYNPDPLYGWLERIAKSAEDDARSAWLEFKTYFPPSLTAKEDKEFDPSAPQEQQQQDPEEYEAPPIPAAEQDELMADVAAGETGLSSTRSGNLNRP